MKKSETKEILNQVTQQNIAHVEQIIKHQTPLYTSERIMIKVNLLLVNSLNAQEHIKAASNPTANEMNEALNALMERTPEKLCAS